MPESSYRTSSCETSSRDIPAPALHRPGILVGTAIGEAMSWPSRQQRAQLMPAWTRRRARELVEHAETQQLSDVVVPFGLNITPDVLRPGPAAVTDWVCDTAGSAAAGNLLEGWQRRASRLDQVRGPISAMVALDQLAAGRVARGDHNPHAHDDSAALRALGIIAAVGPQRGYELIETDASVTASAEGLEAALLIGRVAELLSHEPERLPELLTEHQRQPTASRVRRNLRQMRERAADAPDLWSAALELDLCTDAVYSYGCLAGDTIPAALTLLEWQLGQDPGNPLDPMSTLAASTLLTRQAGTLPALLGGLLGAQDLTFPEAWITRTSECSGCALEWMRGVPVDPGTRR